MARRLVPLLMVAACAGSPPRPPEVSNRPESASTTGSTVNRDGATVATSYVAIATATLGVARGTIAAVDGPMIGATVVAASPTLQGSMATITDEAGAFSIDSLPPGDYEFTVYYQDLSYQFRGVIRAGHALVVKVNGLSPSGSDEIIEIRGDP